MRSLTTAVIDALTLLAYFAMILPRSQTNRKPSKGSNAPAKASAGSSPTRKPRRSVRVDAGFAGRDCRSKIGQIQTRLCVFGLFEFLGVPSKHCFNVPGRISSAASNNSRTPGLVS
jgi:hypothetical protein